MKTIRFCPRISNKERMLTAPIPAKKNIAQWYKDGETYWKDESGEHPGLKTCKPFIDIMISGYYLVIPFDIHVSEDEQGKLNINWDGPEEWAGFVNERPAQLGSTMPRPAGYRKNHLVWSSMWGWKTPRGWSSIVTHPFNRYELPFITASGLIDSDGFFGSGNIPFYLKDNFVGTIPAGTPYAQIIPIKRSRWNSFPDYGLIDGSEARSVDLRKEGHAYKNVEWFKKDYD